MNASELANKMLEWENAKRQIDALEAEISAAVLDIGKTQNVGNVRASYSAGRKKYDYQAAAEIAEVEPDIVAQYRVTTTLTTTDWRQICKVAKVEEIPFTQPAPSVSVKLLA